MSFESRAHGSRTPGADIPSFTDTFLGHGVAWWPLGVFTREPFEARALPVWGAWFGLTVLSVLLAVVESASGWSGLPVTLWGHTVGFSIYPPIGISALVAFWFGPAFGAVTAYASGLASGLGGGLAIEQAAFFGLGTPAGVLLLWFLVLVLRVRPEMPAYRDWWRFGAAALIAMTSSSLDVMLYNEWHRLPLLQGQRTWQGWILGDTAQLCLVVAPVLRMTWRRVHQELAQRLGAPHRDLSAFNTVLLLGVVWTTLAGLALLGLRLMATAFDVPEELAAEGGEWLAPRLQEMQTFVVVLVGALLLSTMALTAELVSRHEKTVALSLRDDLTGAFNRRAFHRLFEREEERSRAFGQPVSLIYFDLDRFKLINDRHGHRVGDAVLIGVTREAHAMLRPQDLLFRWGGDEFVILLPHTPREEAHEIGARLRARVEAQVAAVDAPLPAPVTISVGVATVHPDEADRDDLVEAADTAVRLAKALGRNRVATDVMVDRGAPSV
jgi:diguanylate cyclase (GGDEF)-like protein